MNKSRNVYIMYAIALLQGMVFYAPVATLYRQQAGLSVFQITLIESIFFVFSILLEIPWGVVADRIGYRNTMLICCVLYFSSKIVFYKANDFAMFLLERIMLSIVISGLSGVDSSILFLSCKKDKSQSVFSVYDTLANVGLLFSAGVYSLFIGKDYRLAGLLTVISYGIAAVLAFFLADVKPENAKEKFSFHNTLDVFKGVFKSGYLLLFLLAVTLLNETHQTVTVFLNQLQYVRCSMSANVIGICYIIVTVAGLLGGLSARLTKKVGVKRTGISIFFVSALSLVVLALTKNAFLSVGAIIILRIGFSLFQPLQMDIQNKLVTVDDRATALSLNAVITDAAAIPINLIFGAAAEASLPGAMLFGTGIVVVGLVLYIFVYNNFLRKKSA